MKEILLALMITGICSASAWAAAPDGQEDICNNSAVFFCENWEARAPGAGDFSSAKYKSPGWAKSRPTGPDQTVVQGQGYNGSKAFQFQYQAGNNTGPGYMTADWPGGPYRTVYYRWMVKYSSNFVWSAVATKHDEFYFAGTGARTPQLMWYSGTGAQVTTKKAPQQFLYASSAGDNHAFSQNDNLPTEAITVGQWYCMEVKVTMNTCNTCSDGSLEGWINGVRRFNLSNMVIDNQGETKIKGLLMSGYWNCYGGGDSCTGGSIDNHPTMSRVEDNQVASTQRIGCPTDSTDVRLPAPTNLRVN